MAGPGCKASPILTPRRGCQNPLLGMKKWRLQGRRGTAPFLRHPHVPPRTGGGKTWGEKPSSGPVRPFSGGVPGSVITARPRRLVLGSLCRTCREGLLGPEVAPAGRMALHPCSSALEAGAVPSVVLRVRSSLLPGLLLMRGGRRRCKMRKASLPRIHRLRRPRRGVPPARRTLYRVVGVHPALRMPTRRRQPSAVLRLISTKSARRNRWRAGARTSCPPASSGVGREDHPRLVARRRPVRRGLLSLRSLLALGAPRWLLGRLNRRGGGRPLPGLAGGVVGGGGNDLLQGLFFGGWGNRSLGRPRRTRPRRRCRLTPPRGDGRLIHRQRHGGRTSSQRFVGGRWLRLDHWP